MSGEMSLLPEGEDLDIPELLDDGDVGELCAPAVELLDLVHVADPGPRHDHVLVQLDHPDPALCSRHTHNK